MFSVIIISFYSNCVPVTLIGNKDYRYSEASFISATFDLQSKIPSIMDHNEFESIPELLMTSITCHNVMSELCLQYLLCKQQHTLQFLDKH